MGCLLAPTTRKQWSNWQNMSESRRDKWQKKLTNFCHFGQITVNSDVFCQFYVTMNNLLSILCHLSRLDSDMFLSIRQLFSCSDHASRSCPKAHKICDWLLNSTRDHFGLHQGKHVRVTMDFGVRRRHIVRPTLSTDMVQRVLQWGERQKKCSSRNKEVEKCCYN